MESLTSAAVSATIEPLGSSTYIICADLIHKCVGSRLWIIMKDKREFVGTLCGFDDYVNVVLTDTTL